MRFEDLNWMDVEEYLKQDDRLMIVLGACEQHGYLSLLTDVRIPLTLADAASKQTGVLIAPSINFGVSPYFLQYPGTLSVRIETLARLIEDIIHLRRGWVSTLSRSERSWRQFRRSRSPGACGQQSAENRSQLVHMVGIQQRGCCLPQTQPDNRTRRLGGSLCFQSCH